MVVSCEKHERQKLKKEAVTYKRYVDGRLYSTRLSERCLCGFKPLLSAETDVPFLPEMTPSQQIGDKQSTDFGQTRDKEAIGSLQVHANAATISDPATKRARLGPSSQSQPTK